MRGGLAALLGVVLLVGEVKGECYTDQTIVDRLMEDYKPYKIPGPSVGVQAELWVSDLISLDPVTTELTLSVYLSVQWQDPALNYESWMRSPRTRPCYNNVTANTDIPIWTPFISFITDRDTEILKSPKANVYYSIMPNGTIWTVRRVKVTIPCEYDLTRYPRDTATCKLQLESYRYRLAEVDLRWAEHPILFLNQRKVRDYDLKEVGHYRKEVTYPAGRWAELFAVLNFERKVELPVLFLYMPSSLFVLVSWLAFFLHPGSLTPRTLLALQAILALPAMGWYYRDIFPVDGLFNRISIWLGVCILFALASLVETVVAYHWSGCCVRRKRRKYQFVPNPEEEGNHLFQKTSDYTVDDEDTAGGSGRCWSICASVVDYVALLVFPGLFAAFAALYFLNVF